MDSTASTLSSTSITRIPAGWALAGGGEVSDMQLGALSVAAPGTLPAPDYVSRRHSRNCRAMFTFCPTCAIPVDLPRLARGPSTLEATRQYPETGMATTTEAACSGPRTWAPEAA